MKSNSDLIELLRDNEVIKFGKFRLSSGIESHYYVDIKKAITNPLILSEVAGILSDKINKMCVDRVAGPALGAIPIVTAVSLYSDLPMIMIRKAKKDYGTTNLIEGDLEEGNLVVVLEDVTTTGNSLLTAIEAILKNGGKVKKAFVIVDRAEGAIDNLEENGIILEPLVSVNDLK
ncbi:MAG: orotate phosphoribosyltransferase [Methanobacterium sp.]|jgi:orotate phosphoribosyltransferase